MLLLIKNLRLWISLTVVKNLCSEISQKNRFGMSEKSKVPGQFIIKHHNKKKIDVGQQKISVNVPTQVYLTMIKIETFLISHRKVTDCRMTMSDNML